MDNNNMNNDFNNQQPMNNSQKNPAMQGFQQQVQQPMYNKPPKKDNKKLFILIGVGVLIAVAVIVLIVVLIGNNSKGNTINDFEDSDVVDSNINVQEEEDNTNNTIAFQGFSIRKQAGYQYEIDESGLSIGNNFYATYVTVVPGNFEILKSSQTNLVNEYTNLGYNPTNVKIANYENKEVMTIELTSQGQRGLFYLMSADNNHSFLGMAMNSNYTFNYNDINTTVSLLSSAKYTGSYKAPTDKLSTIEFKDLFE